MLFDEACPLRIMASEYTEDGKRLEFITSTMLQHISFETDIPRYILDSLIARQVAELTAVVHALGYAGYETFDETGAIPIQDSGNYMLKTTHINNCELHLSNFRLIVKNGIVLVILVGDFEGFTKLTEFEDPDEAREKDISGIIAGVKGKVPGLKDILNINAYDLHDIFILNQHLRRVSPPARIMGSGLFIEKSAKSTIDSAA